MRRALLAVGLLLSSTGQAGPEVRAPPVKPGQVQKAPAVRRGLGAPEYLNELARGLLKRRMARHGRDMLELVQSVVLLERAATLRLAQELAAEPRLTRPIAGGMDDLNAALPERFFVLQDELRSRALALAEAARQKDAPGLAARFGELTQTCVACHSTYLEPPRPAAAPDAGP